MEFYRDAATWMTVLLKLNINFESSCTHQLVQQSGSILSLGKVPAPVMTVLQFQVSRPGAAGPHRSSKWNICMMAVPALARQQPLPAGHSASLPSSREDTHTETVTVTKHFSVWWFTSASAFALFPLHWFLIPPDKRQQEGRRNRLITAARYQQHTSSVGCFSPFPFLS